MTILSLDHEVRYSGHKAFVAVELVDAVLATRVDMVLDTGAEISLLNREHIAPLGIKIADGDRISLIVANGEMTMRGSIA